jgi:hypothetical protein
MTKIQNKLNDWNNAHRDVMIASRQKVSETFSIMPQTGISDDTLRVEVMKYKHDRHWLVSFECELPSLMHHLYRYDYHECPNKAEAIKFGLDVAADHCKRAVQRERDAA